MRTGPCLVVVMVFVLGAGGCVRRDGRNSDCRWPGETSNHPVSARHLSADAEFAEDLAIRYADAHFGLRSPNPSEKYGAERDRCMDRLFEEIRKEHGVPVGQVSGSLGQSRAYIDMAEVLPFALLYSLAAIVVARMIWRRRGRLGARNHNGTVRFPGVRRRRHHARRGMELVCGGPSYRQ